MNVAKNNFKDMPNPQTALRQLCVGALLLALAACAARTPAPVSDARPAPVTASGQPLPPAITALPGSLPPKPNEPTKIHVIQRGDTMFSVARQYGLDYRELAAWNNIVNPTAIRLGDTLRLTPPGSPGNASVGSIDTNQGTPTTNSTAPLTAGEVVTTPLVVTPPIVIEKPLINTPTLKVEPKASKLAYTDQAYAKMQAESGSAIAPPTLPPAGMTMTPPAPIVAPPPSALPTPVVPPAAPTAVAGMPEWSWPVKGKIVTTFTETTKGIDIAGTRGKPVLAAAAGKVIYNEAGLRGYGRMIIIKHNDQWLTAYAHNEKILVQKDQEIKQGQKIAEMGSSDTDTVKLHFEIRKLGKPVDPMKYLPAQ